MARKKSDSELLITAINAAYAIALSSAKSDEQRARLEKEKKRALQIAKTNPAGFRAYHMAALNNTSVIWSVVTHPRDVWAAARDAFTSTLRIAFVKTAVVLGRRPNIDELDRSAEPKFDANAISQRVLGALVDVDAGQTAVPAQATPAQPKSFTFSYGVPQQGRPPRIGHIHGFASIEELIETIANGKSTPALARILSLISPMQGEAEVASWTFACRLLEGIGKRMVQPISNQQFLNLQIYMIAGIKQVRPEIDADDAYENFAEKIAERLKEYAQQTGAPETVGLGELENVVTVTEGRQSRGAQNRDIIRRAGLEPAQPPAAILSFLQARLDKGPRPPLSPQRIEEIARLLPTKPTDPA